jgi:hypothetical protein
MILKLILARHWWFMPIILATQEADIRRIKRAGGVAQDIGPEFKSQ